MGTYEVGYKKPPKQWQFQKGQSGNPLGRKAFKPCGEHRLSSALAAELDQPVSVRRNGKLGKLTSQRAIIKSVIHQAISGSIVNLELAVRWMVQYRLIAKPFIESGYMVRTLQQRTDLLDSLKAKSRRGERMNDSDLKIYYAFLRDPIKFLDGELRLPGYDKPAVIDLIKFVNDKPYLLPHGRVAPSGKQKPRKSFEHDLLEELCVKRQLIENGRKRTRTIYQLLMRRIVHEAGRGNRKAVALVLMMYNECGGMNPIRTRRRTASIATS
jgi:Family of unknown function (DUF5681)